MEPHQKGSPEGQVLGWILIALGVAVSIVHPIGLFPLVLGLFTLAWCLRPS